MKVTNEIILGLLDKHFKNEQFEVQQIHQHTPTFLKASMIEEDTELLYKKYHELYRYLKNWKNEDLEFLVFWNALQFKTLEKIEHKKIDSEEDLVNHFKETGSTNYICMYEDIIVVRVDESNHMFDLVEFIDEIKPHLLYEDFNNKFRESKKQKVNKI